MIRIVLQARLGNQLFQYAAARALALKHQSDIILDLSLLGRNYKRDYALCYFNINTKVSSFFPNYLYKKIYKKYYWERNLEIFRETIPNSYDENINQYSKQATLVGFFQSAHYFSEFKEKIKSELSIKPLPEHNYMIQQEKTLQDEIFVGIHVRRADYLEDQKFNICDIHFYREAIDHFIAKEKSTKIIFFSDDINWCRNMFKGSNFYFSKTAENKLPSIYDFKLLSLCRHFIIPNSTFSWWAAYLSKYEDSVTIMPNRFFVGDESCIENKKINQHTIFLPV